MKQALALGADTYNVKPSNSDGYMRVLMKVYEQVRLQRGETGVPGRP